MAGFVTEKGFGLASNSSPAGHGLSAKAVWENHVQGLQDILIRKSRAFSIIKSHPEDIR